MTSRLARRLRRPLDHCLVGAALLVAFTACERGDAKASKQAEAPIPTVLVVEVPQRTVQVAADFVARTEAVPTVEIRARISGVLEHVRFREGSEVKKGQVLFVIQQAEYSAALQSARAQLAKAEADLLRAKDTSVVERQRAQLDQAKADLGKNQADVARYRPLVKEQAIPQQDLDNALASVDVGKANVQSMESRVESAKIDLSYCDVKAPLSGLIGAKQVSAGSLVGKGEPTLLATISPLDPIWFYCNLGEVEYLKAAAEVRRTGKKITNLNVTLVLADGSAHPDSGKIVFVDRAVDSKTGTLRIRAEFPNPQKSLRPGMFARVKVDVGTLPEGILVPERAVMELQGRNFVWVVDQENKATQRPVKVGARIGSDWLVEDGLKPGGRIIVEGVQKAREGAVVKPMTAAEMAPTLAAASVKASPPAAKREKE